MATSQRPFDLKAFDASVVGRKLDLDAVFPGECHDLWLAFLYDLGGKAGDGWAPGGGATVHVWNQFPYARPGLAQLFTKRHGTGGIRAGDVLFWKHGASFPGSHVAIATGPTAGGFVPTLTQNPGPVKHAVLTTTDLIGYLRPKQAITYGGPITTNSTEDEMQSINVDGKHLYGVTTEFITHYGDSTQADTTRKVTSGNDELHRLSTASFNSLLDGLGIPRDVVQPGKVLNPQSGKFERNGTWSRHREILAKLGVK